MSYEQTSELQRPDLGVESVELTKTIHVSNEQFPWLQHELREVHMVRVQMDDGIAFNYGSIVGGNSSVEKLADEVSPQHSINAERGMFKALPAILKHQTAPNIEFVPLADTSETVLKTTKKGADVARLYFSVSVDDSGQPVVLKLGIAKHKKQEQLMGILRQSTNRRRKKDGGSR